MDQEKIVCLGDSNTYGYNPYNYFGDPYDTPWPLALERLTGKRVINLGENGAEIPHRERDFYWLRRNLTQFLPVSVLIIMLGSNDLLNSRGYEVPDTGKRMEGLVAFLKKMLPETQLVLLAPPQLCRMEALLNPACLELTELYRDLAEREHLLFSDPKEWQLQISADGVHLEEGTHLLFAEKVAELLSA